MYPTRPTLTFEIKHERKKNNPIKCTNIGEGMEMKIERIMLY